MLSSDTYIREIELDVSGEIELMLYRKFNLNFEWRWSWMFYREIKPNIL